jgi:hypothetical protein
VRTISEENEMTWETTHDVLSEVLAERGRQNAKWGEQNHPNGTGPHVVWRSFSPEAADACKELRDRTNLNAQTGELTWLDILLEEIAEAFAEDDPAKLRAELVQLGAVAVAWVEAVDRAASR